MIETLKVDLEGNLTDTVLTAAFQKITPDLLKPGKKGIIIDCTEMTGYELSARSVFVDWNTQHKQRIRAVAVVTKNPLWHMVIRTMSLASGQTIRPFGDVTAAHDWLSSLEL